VDLVVPLRQSLSGQNFEEFRYALRSYPGDGEVWLLGGKPAWAVGVNHVPMQQVHGKYGNVRRMMRWACQSDLVSDPFLWSNDDIWWTGTETPMLHGGPFSTYVQRLNGSYARGGRETLKLLRQQGYWEPLSWSLHTPIVVHKAAMREALDIAGTSPVAIHVRTLYGNIHGLSGTEHRDVKIHTAGLPEPSWPFVSTSDEAFARREIGVWIRNRFTTPSRFEAT
jgi:hypothetical protein